MKPLGIKTRVLISASNDQSNELEQSVHVVSLINRIEPAYVVSLSNQHCLVVLNLSLYLHKSKSIDFDVSFVIFLYI